MAGLRNFIYKQYRGKDGYFKEKEGNPPVWKPEGWFDSIFLKFKDWLWRPVIEQAIQDYQLYDFDVVHFESGSDFLKNEFFVKELHERGKKIIAHYHGEDMRARGVMPIIDDLSDLNLTNEVDLLDNHPNLDYLFLPFDTNQFIPNYGLNKTIQVAHAPTIDSIRDPIKLFQSVKNWNQKGLSNSTSLKTFLMQLL